MKVIALVDGEHYPPVTRWALASARAAGHDVLAALLVGGAEKLDAARSIDLGEVPVITGSDRPRAALASAIEELDPEGVLDLSDEPVMGYEQRMELIGVTLAAGIPYVGPDFWFDPPIVEAALAAPTVAVIGTGKRVSKTAVAGHVARLAAADGRRPVVVAMGRGGPPQPVVAGPEDVTVEALLARVDRHEHAASDFLEDALTARVPTVGARRAGGGLAGRPFVTNVAAAAARAVELGGDPVILEGSGAAVPTVPWDAGVLVAPASLPEHHLGGYLGPLRILLSDLVVFIMGVGSHTGAENLSTLHSSVRRLRPDIRIAVAELQPVPLGDVRGKDVYLATTAPLEVAQHLAHRLDETAGCRVVGVTSHLADRAALAEELDGAPAYEVLVTELKAAAVDVAAKSAMARGAGVVFLDNRPTTAGGDGEVDDLIRQVVAAARERA
ncbi:MAG TPA: 2,3-diphosphoglycerate synthetase, partial [Actinomycetota bacterium]|nr:2,3-diphosphoglycerate synthetase [Actinomycetota bacterium]